MLQKRCSWCEKDEMYRNYHDLEWGVPIYDDTKLFEYLLLETFQAGLSWYTILKKRANFRTAFENFDYKKIAEFTDDKILELNQNTGIIRNKLKIAAAVKNAKRFMEIQAEFGSFSNYIWAFVNNKPIDNQPKTMADVPATSPLSDIISKDLKKRGFKFIGSTTLYAHMQATGMVNDHIISCFTRST